MKILITGAGGFVGQLLAEHLLNDAHDLILTDIFEPPIPENARHPANAKCVAADLYETPGSVLAADLAAIFIFHGIMSAGSEENFELGYRVNLHSTLRLLEAIRQTCPGTKVIFASSIAVFGKPHPGLLPDVVSERSVPTPQSSYGTQKAMIELAINDYTRRGYIEGWTVRLPTISVRPGKPTQAASSWMSGLVREPLQGKVCVLPIEDNHFKVFLCSPRTLVNNLKHVLTLSRDTLPSHLRQIQLPGVEVTVSDMLDALRTIGGTKALEFVKHEKADEKTIELLESWPSWFDFSAAKALGFVEDQDFLATVEDFAAGLKKGKSK